MAFLLTNERLAAYAEHLGAVVEPGLRLFGIRGAEPYGGDPSGQSIRLVKNELDLWNDTLGFWGPRLELFSATVDPGLKYTDEPLNPLGAAHLLGLDEGGKVWHFKPGIHKGQYEALVQAEAFTVRRDKDRDGAGEPVEPLQTGEFGIHIHHAGGRSEHVGAWSAGCQVLKGGNEVGGQWRRFYQAYKDSGQSTFAYYLFDGAKLAEFLGV